MTPKKIILGKEHYDKILEESAAFLNVCEHARQSARIPSEQKQSVIEQMAEKYGFVQVKDLWVIGVPQPGVLKKGGKGMQFILPNEVYDLIEEYHKPNL